MDEVLGFSSVFGTIDAIRFPYICIGGEVLRVHKDIGAVRVRDPTTYIYRKKMKMS